MRERICSRIPGRSSSCPCQATGDPVRLSAVDVATGRERLIHEYPPDNCLYGEVSQATARLYPSRDGKYLLGPRWSVRASIWLLEGVEPPLSFWHRLLR